MNIEDEWYKLMEMYGLKSITRKIEFERHQPIRFVISWEYKDEEERKKAPRFGEYNTSVEE
jgi:hypothetical protein